MVSYVVRLNSDSMDLVEEFQMHGNPSRIYRLVLDTRKLSSGCGNNKGADQPAHLRRLISTFVIRLLESIISKLATHEIF